MWKTRSPWPTAIGGHVLAGGVIMGEFVASKQMLEFQSAPGTRRRSSSDKIHLRRPRCESP